MHRRIMHAATHNPLCIVVHNAAERRCWRERRFKRRKNVQVPDGGRRGLALSLSLRQLLHSSDGAHAMVQH